ncbi:MAG: hypothetical protein ACLFQK_06290 [Fibrobacterota bacterium]
MPEKRKKSRRIIFDGDHQRYFLLRVMTAAALLCLASAGLVILYSAARFSRWTLYTMPPADSPDIMQTFTVTGFIFPFLIPITLAGIAASCTASGFISRKTGIIIYRIKKWASGNSEKISFRQKDRLNKVSDNLTAYREKINHYLKAIEDEAQYIENNSVDPVIKKRAENIKKEIEKI